MSRETRVAVIGGDEANTGRPDDIWSEVGQ